MCIAITLSNMLSGLDLGRRQLFKNENEFLHLNFSQDPDKEYEYWINEIGIDGLSTDFTGSLHNYQEWTSPLSETSKSPRQLLGQIVSLVIPYAKA
ncbi:unnamed protein product [Brassica oleracea]